VLAPASVKLVVLPCLVSIPTNQSVDKK